MNVFEAKAIWCIKNWNVETLANGLSTSLCIFVPRVVYAPLSRRGLGERRSWLSGHMAWLFLDSWTTIFTDSMLVSFLRMSLVDIKDQLNT